MAKRSDKGPEDKGRDQEPEEHEETVVNDKRRIDPETGDVRSPSPEGEPEALDDEDLEILDEAERDLVGEYRERAARAEAELANFRSRVERDRQSNREAIIVEVIRSLLPAIDDLDRAEKHGDLAGTPLEIVSQKVRQSFERYGMIPVGTVGEAFDPAIHEAMVHMPSDEVTLDTVADVIEVGYQLGERLIRPAKVAVSSPPAAPSEEDDK
ncbi:nucleotide exchange factor GrpE [Pontimonas sp.]|jgi:molecular chaperone GrpE|uniref:nucleotide exchange factor GrpE n=1 Tax=Pontimonas sp. TaxID=2304492 RepID=UPI00286FCB09|nr:nucleotide exchange factor GrpE [Pontimonas sp.]MDR9396366.1 nucleotide exchange factor GrpE [Pontimonas sp.]MDR9434964.1 nucleotide exchange factor GrpE [Pontimonas sp.]